MTGQFTVVPAAAPRPDHLHVVFELDRGKELRFRDPRRFGSIEYYFSAADTDYAFNSVMGPEPFGLDADEFRRSFALTRRNLKAILLDQSFVAGVGNIYADESCFQAQLHPARRGQSLTPAECDRLRAAIETVLARAIESRGSSIRDYIGGSGLRGEFQNEFAVYGRTGAPCPNCAAAIECIRLAGRSTHYCSTCQKISPRSTQSPQRKSPMKTNGKSV
jgi:formamidopyrimidine-DNA glycosylase